MWWWKKWSWLRFLYLPELPRTEFREASTVHGPHRSRVRPRQNRSGSSLLEDWARASFGALLVVVFEIEVVVPGIDIQRV